MIVDFKEITEELRHRGVELEDFYTFLAQKYEPQSFAKTEYSPEMEFLKRVGLKLLFEGKTTVWELNHILNLLPKINVKELLRYFLREKKLIPEEFISLAQGELTELQKEEKRFKMRLKSGIPEFYLEKSEEDESYGQYHILKEVARGGMGIVYKAYHPQLNRVCALKVLIAGEGASNESFKRFYREIQATTKLKHPYIVEVLDSGQRGGELYYVMEFVHGITLDAWLEQKPKVREGVQLIQKCIKALHYAHTQGVIHRDIKPENILVNIKNEPKLSDFGLAKDLTLTQKSQKLTHSNAVFGTPAYMSPEQVRGEVAKIDSKSDVFSIGVCLYEVITGQRPFQASTEHHLFEQILYGDPIPPSRLNAEIHRDLETILLKSLEKERYKRYSTALMFAEDLERFLNGSPILAKPLGVSERFQKWVRSHRLMFTLSCLICLLGSIFLGYSYWSKQTEEFQRQNLAVQEELKRSKAKQKRFDDIFVVAKEAFKEALKQEEKQIEKRIEFLLKSMQHLNTGLSIKPNEPEVEKVKLEVGELLIELACHSKNYQLADYIATDIQTMASVELKWKKTLLNLVEEEQNKTVRQEKDRLTYWIELLKLKNQETGTHERALLEISKMQSKAIFQKLLEILAEGTEYFLGEEGRSAPKSEYYETMVTALGWLENPKAREPLFQALEKMIGKSFSSSRKNVADLQYMVLLARAIGNIKAPNTSQDLQKMRLRMGRGGEFWKNTKLIYQELAILEGLEQEDPTNSEAYLERANAKLEQGNIEGAIEDYNDALLLEPENAKLYMKRGLARLVKKEIDEAIEDYSKAILLDSKLFLAYFYRGEAKEILKDFESALIDYALTIRLHSKFAPAYHNSGKILFQNGKMKQALEAFNLALFHGTQNVDVYYRRGNVKFIQGDLKGAFADFNQAIQLNPKYALSYLGRGNTKFKKNNINGAIEDYNEAIQLNPQLIDAYLQRGNAKYRQMDYVGAIEDYNEAIRMDPNCAKAFIYRGVIKEKISKTQAALEDLNQAILLDPKSYEAYHYRGIIRYGIGRAKEAKEDFLNYLKQTELLKREEILQNRSYILQRFPELGKEKVKSKE